MDFDGSSCAVVRELEYQFLLCPRTEWVAATAETIGHLDLPDVLNLLSLRSSFLVTEGVDIFSGLDFSSDPVLQSLLSIGLLADENSLCSPAEKEDLLKPIRLSAGTLIRVSSKACFSPFSPFMRFLESVNASLRARGLSPQLAALAVAAVEEMSSNAVEHARSSSPPVVAFAETEEGWVFSVTDLGRGLKASLEASGCSLESSGRDAMDLCLTDGVSCLPDTTRGYGFTTLFKALADRLVQVVLRSDAVAAEWVGVSPTRQSLTYHLLRARRGFHLEVRFGG